MTTSATMRRATSWLVLTLSTAAFAQTQTTVVTAVLEAPGVTDATVKRLQRTTEGVLKQLSSFSVEEGPVFRKGAPRRCSGDECAQQLVRSLGSPAAVLLELKGSGDRLTVELQLWLDGERLGSRRGDGSIEGFEAAVRPVLETLLPAWARRGFGGLRFDVESSSLVKIDGRQAPIKPKEIMALPSGPHQVDVVSVDGHAVLQRIEVVEGSRVRVDSTDAGRQAVAEVKGARAAVSGLRVTSYAVWMAGAATVAAGLVAGALGRGTAAGLSPCTGTNRDCATLDTVLERNRQAQAYAATGNVLLGVGGGLAAVGAGLFIIDFATE